MADRLSVNRYVGPNFTAHAIALPPERPSFRRIERDRDKAFPLEQVDKETIPCAAFGEPHGQMFPCHVAIEQNRYVDVILPIKKCSPFSYGPEKSTSFQPMYCADIDQAAGNMTRELFHMLTAAGCCVEAETVDVEIEGARRRSLATTLPTDTTLRQHQFTDSMAPSERWKITLGLSLKDRKVIVTQGKQSTLPIVPSLAKEPCQFDGHGCCQNGMELDVRDNESCDERRGEKPQSSMVAVLCQKFNQPRCWLEGDGRGRDDEEQDNDKTE
ncbi:MAG: hypothetical protein OEU92_21635 [Alphaproteobacteria bacterium]|nr:hypothetical protein [Alphaproteobacteria bacterium]